MQHVANFILGSAVIDGWDALRETPTLVREEFVEAFNTNQKAFDLDLPTRTIERLADYYELIQHHNEFLHLVGPCSPEEFAIRHILESLTLLEYLPHGSKFADVGTGAGLPSIPCLIVREDLKAILIESKEKKSKFLDIAVKHLGINNRSRIVNQQFQKVDPADCNVVTCRALDKFTERLPLLIKWTMRRRMLLFGGWNLREALKAQKIGFAEKLMPLSKQRFLYAANFKIRYKRIDKERA